MIQDVEDFIKYINSEMDFDQAIGFLKENAANQITCTKVIRKVYNLRLSEADKIVQNSKHWVAHEEGNDSLKNQWFDT